MALSPYVRGRFDLSEDGKYTLSESSEIILNSIDAPIRIQVYLGGDDLPGGFKRLQKETLDLLADMQSSASTKMEVQVIDVYDEYPTEEARASLTHQLDSLGIPPTNLVHKENGKQVQQLIFPGLVITKGALKTGVLLLKGNKLASPEEIINQSIEGLEFEIVQAIQQLLPQERKKIGFFVEYSSTSAVAQIDLVHSLQRKYDLFPVDLAASIDRLLTKEGEFAVLYPADVLAQFEQSLQVNGLFLHEKVTIHSNPSSPVLRVMANGSRKNNPIKQDRINIKTELGEYSPEFIELLRPYYIIFPS